MNRSRKSFWSTGSSEPVFQFLKKYQIFLKKYLHVANDKDYKSANCQYNISCILGATKKTNMPKFENTGGPFRIALFMPRSTIFSFL
jgi:hypothetical protein